MKSLFVMYFILISWNFSYAQNTGNIHYGNYLCEEISFITNQESACKIWVIDNAINKNVYDIALSVCVGFDRSISGSARRSDCFEKASRMISPSNIRDQVDLCNHRNNTYPARAHCMSQRFQENNVRLLSARDAALKEQQKALPRAQRTGSKRAQ